MTGTVERFLVDDFATHVPGGEDDALTFVNTASGAVQVPTSSLELVADGATVRVALADSATAEVSADGVEATGATATDTESGATVTSLAVVAQPAAGLTDTGTSAAPAAATVQATSGATHHVLVVVAMPSNGSASSVSAADVAATVRGSVSSYWSKMTRGEVTFDATAYPSVVSTTSTPCATGGDVSGSFDFWAEIKARTGWVEGPGKHLVVYFRTLAACGGIAGLGTVGSDKTSGGVLWSNGYSTTGVIGHELGHNLSLGHSSTLACTSGGARVTDAGDAACVKKPYLDTNDIMGVSWQNQGYLNGSHLRYLGMLASSAAQAQPTSSGRVTLAPLAVGLGLRLLTLTDGTTSYVVEYRTAVGQDAWMSGATGWGSTGVTVRRETRGSVAFPLRESFLLDGDPTTADATFGALDASLPGGHWVSLADGGLRLKVASTSTTGAVVDYEIGGQPAPARLGEAILDLTDPAASLRTGAMKRTAAGPVVPVLWQWRISTRVGHHHRARLDHGLRLHGVEHAAPHRHGDERRHVRVVGDGHREGPLPQRPRRHVVRRLLDQQRHVERQRRHAAPHHPEVRLGDHDGEGIEHRRPPPAWGAQRKRRGLRRRRTGRDGEHARHVHQRAGGVREDLHRHGDPHREGHQPDRWLVRRDGLRRRRDPGLSAPSPPRPRSLRGSRGREHQ